jgi:hypothetical protein
MARKCEHKWIHSWLAQLHRCEHIDRPIKPAIDAERSMPVYWLRSNKVIPASILIIPNVCSNGHCEIETDVRPRAIKSREEGGCHGWCLHFRAALLYMCLFSFWRRPLLRKNSHSCSRRSAKWCRSTARNCSADLPACQSGQPHMNIHTASCEIAKQ